MEQPKIRDERLEIRCKETTMTTFLEIRAKFRNHEDTLIALMKFFKERGGTQTIPLKGTTYAENK